TRWLAAGVGAAVGAAATWLLAASLVPDAWLSAVLVLLGAGVAALLGLRQPPVPSMVHWHVASGLRRIWSAASDLRRLRRVPLRAGGVWWLVGAAVVVIVGVRAGWLAIVVGGAAIVVVRGLDAWLDVPADVGAVPA